MAEQQRLRATVFEEEYGVFARVSDRDEDGSASFRSDQIAEAYRISERLRAIGHRPEMMEGDDGVFVRLFVGDAPEREFAEAGWDMVEASSW